MFSSSHKNKNLIKNLNHFFKKKKRLDATSGRQNRKKFQKIWAHQWRASDLRSKKLFSFDPTWFCKTQNVFKLVNIPNNFQKKWLSEMGKTSVRTTEKAKWRSEGDDVAITLDLTWIEFHISSLIACQLLVNLLCKKKLLEVIHQSKMKFYLAKLRFYLAELRFYLA